MKVCNVILYFLLTVVYVDCSAADKTDTPGITGEDIAKMSGALEIFETTMVQAVSKRDDVTIDNMINDDRFRLLAMVNPGTLLWAATRFHNFKVLDALLKKGADINSPPDTSGQTALYTAVHSQDAQMVQYLLNHGIDAFKVDFYYYTALDRAVKGSKSDCAIIILTAIKRKGMLDTYLNWEEILSKVRARGSSVAVRDNDILLQVRRLSKLIEK